MGAVAAQTQQTVELCVLVGLFHGGDLVDLVLLDHAHHLKRGALGAEDGTAQSQDAAEVVLGHILEIAVDQAMISVQDTNDLHVVPHAGVQRFGDAADGRVQARAVTAGSEDTNTFFQCKSLFSFFLSGDRQPEGQRLLPIAAKCPCLLCAPGRICPAPLKTG